MTASNTPSGPRTDWVAQLRNMHGDVELWDELVDVVDAATWCYQTQFAAYGYKSQLEAALANLKGLVKQ